MPFGGGGALTFGKYNTSKKARCATKRGANTGNSVEERRCPSLGGESEVGKAKGGGKMG